MEEVSDNNFMLFKERMYSRLGQRAKLEQLATVNSCLISRKKNISLFKFPNTEKFSNYGNKTVIRIKVKRPTSSFRATNRSNSYNNYHLVIGFITYRK